MIKQITIVVNCFLSTDLEKSIIQFIKISAYLQFFESLFKTFIYIFHIHIVKIAQIL